MAGPTRFPYLVLDGRPCGSTTGRSFCTAGNSFSLVSVLCLWQNGFTFLLLVSNSWLRFVNAIFSSLSEVFRVDFSFGYRDGLCIISEKLFNEFKFCFVLVLRD